MKKRLFDYDDRDKASIYEYAKQLESMTFNEIKEEFEKSIIKSYVNRYEPHDMNEVHEDSKVYGASFNYEAKGQLGNFVERFYFGYDPNGNQDADFPKAGIELKLTPIDKRKDGSLRAGERLSITNISFDEQVEEDFYKSHVWNKIKQILLIHYLRDKSVDRMDYMIQFVNLFSPMDHPNDLKIIKEDYETIIKKIKDGKAHELSESDTYYLGACTKGSTADSSWRPQFYGNHELAKKRNFCFKNSYMEYVLQKYIIKNDVPSESVIKEKLETTFEEHIISRINNYIGRTDKQLCNLFDREYNNNKAQWSDLTYRMLGIKGNHAEEFEKANIVVKTIRIEENGKNKESMSFPAFKFKELVEEKWEDSTVYRYFDTTKFLFVVFKKHRNEYKLEGCKLWNMPYEDLNVTVKKEWQKIVNTIKTGVKFTLKEKRNGKIEISNNLPGISDNEILHVRPHASQSAYKLNNGYQKGNIQRDANELPNGEYMTTQSFWINSSYILKQI